MTASRGQPREVDCIDFVERVTDYLEGALEAEDARALEHHLTICDDCQTYLEQMRATMRVTGKLAVDDIPPDGMDALLDAFRAYQAERAGQ